MQVLSADVGIDWISCVSQNEYSARVMSDVFQEAYEEARADIHEPREFFVGPYRGIAIHNVSWGVNDDGATILTISGAPTRQQFERLIDLPHLRLTRLDLQVTLELANAAKLATRYYMDLTLKDLEKRYNVKPVIMQSADGGSTLYLGSRKGRGYFARIYDKGVQAKIARPGKLWRYEVQAKRKQATKIWRSIKENCQGPTHWAGFVVAYFADRGVIMPDFEYLEFNSVLRDADNNDSNIKSKLRWLRTNVRPCVTNLRLAGYTEQVYNALGLSKEL